MSWDGCGKLVTCRKRKQSLCSLGLRTTAECGPPSGDRLGVVHLFVDDKAEKGEEKDPAVMTQSEETPAEEDLLGPNCYYDKSKSFFDNISSELKTR